MRRQYKARLHIKQQKRYFPLRIKFYFLSVFAFLGQKKIKSIVQKKIQPKSTSFLENIFSKPQFKLGRNYHPLVGSRLENYKTEFLWRKP